MDVDDSDSGYESEPTVVVKKAPKAKCSKRKRNDKEKKNMRFMRRQLRRGHRFGNIMIRWVNGSK